MACNDGARPSSRRDVLPHVPLFRGLAAASPSETTSTMHALPNMLKQHRASRAKWRRRRSLRRRFTPLIDARLDKPVPSPLPPQEEVRDIARVLEQWRASLSDG